MRSTGSASEVIVPDSISDLQTQLAHLKWRKVSNDNKIRNKIATSKALAERDLLLALSEKKSKLKAQWRATVIEQELGKPLEVDEAKLRALEEDSKIQEERSLRQVEVHQKAMNALETKLTGRENMGPREKRRGSTSAAREHVAALHSKLDAHARSVLDVHEPQAPGSVSSFAT